MRGRPAKDTRKCQRCKHELPKSEFYANGKSYANVCKGCNTDDVLERSYRRMSLELLEQRIQQIERQYYTALRIQKERVV
jgi:hypothetical protein